MGRNKNHLQYNPKIDKILDEEDISYTLNANSYIDKIVCIEDGFYKIREILQFYSIDPSMMGEVQWEGKYDQMVFQAENSPPYYDASIDSHCRYELIYKEESPTRKGTHVVIHTNDPIGYYIVLPKSYIKVI